MYFWVDRRVAAGINHVSFERCARDARTPGTTPTPPGAATPTLPRDRGPHPVPRSWSPPPATRSRPPPRRTTRVPGLPHDPRPHPAAPPRPPLVALRRRSSAVCTCCDHVTFSCCCAPASVLFPSFLFFGRMLSTPPDRAATVFCPLCVRCLAVLSAHARGALFYPLCVHVLTNCLLLWHQDLCVGRSTLFLCHILLVMLSGLVCMRVPFFFLYRARPSVQGARHRPSHARAPSVVLRVCGRATGVGGGTGRIWWRRV